MDTNCRTGPGDAYPRVGGLLVGQTAEVHARDPSGEYLSIANPTRAGKFCWIWAQYARVSGPPVSLPVFTPILPPADATVEFAGAVQCMDGVHLAVKITNTGGVTWQSYTASYTDLTTPNGFDQFQTPKFFDGAGCGGQQIIDDLDPANQATPNGRSPAASLPRDIASALPSTCSTPTAPAGNPSPGKWNSPSPCRNPRFRLTLRVFESPAALSYPGYGAFAAPHPLTSLTSLPP